MSDRIAISKGALIACALFVTATAHAQYTSLSSLFDLARSGEPVFLGAKTGVDAARARTDQAMGAMLPQLSATAATNENDRTYKTRNSGVPEAKDNYNSNSAQISLTQPIWRYANIVGWQQAKAVVRQSEHQLAGAEQELVARLVAAWFDLLAARDALDFATQQVAALERQWKVIKRGEELGAYGAPQAEDAAAKLQQAMSDAVTAETDQQLKRAALEQLVGSMGPFDLPFLRGGVELASLQGATLDKYLDEVEVGNPNILSAMQAYEAAGAEVRKLQAGHYPTLDLVGSYGKNSQAVGGFPGQAGYDIKQGAVGLQLNVPIFSGGTQSAKVVEALAQKEKARLDIETARRSALLAAKQAWYGWKSGYARERAGRQGIKSARTALTEARLGQDKGLRTELESLQAMQQLRAAQRDFRKGRYDQAVNYVKLKAATGALSEADVTVIDALFVSNADAAEPEESNFMQVSAR